MYINLRDLEDEHLVLTEDEKSVDYANTFELLKHKYPDTPFYFFAADTNYPFDVDAEGNVDGRAFSTYGDFDGVNYLATEDELEWLIKHRLDTTIHVVSDLEEGSFKGTYSTNIGYVYEFVEDVSGWFSNCILEINSSPVELSARIKQGLFEG